MGKALYAGTVFFLFLYILLPFNNNSHIFNRPESIEMLINGLYH